MRSIPLAASGALALVLAACGSSNANNNPSVTGTRGYGSTSQQLNRICNDLRTQAASLSSQLNGNASHDAPILRKLAAVTQSETNRVRAVKPSGDVKDVFGQYVDALSTNSDQYRQLAQKAAAGDQSAYRQALQQARKDAPDAKPLEKALGALDCTKG